MEKHVRSLLQCSLNSINNSRRKENKTHTTFGAQGRAVIMHFGMKLCLNKLKQDIIVYIIHSPHSVIWWESEANSRKYTETLYHPFMYSPVSLLFSIYPIPAMHSLLVTFYVTD